MFATQQPRPYIGRYVEEVSRDVLAMHASNVSTYRARCCLTQHVQPRCGITKTITRHATTNAHTFRRSNRPHTASLHSWKLKRWSPSSLKHPINEHPVFSEAAEVELPRACAVLSRSEYFEVPPGDEAGVSHANVHRALRGVPADGHRPLLHKILEFSALQPGYRRP